MKNILYWAVFWLFASSLGCTSGAKLVNTKDNKTPFDRFVSENAKKRAETRGKAKPVTFSLASKSEKDTTSVVNWFKKNSLEIKAVSFHDESATACLAEVGKIPSWAGKYISYEVNGKKYHLSHAVEQEGYVLLFYGNPPDMLHIVSNISLLVVRDVNTETVRYSLDMSLYGMAPEYVERDKEHVFQSVRWAYIEAGVLYMENAHWRYAESSKGKNAFISAIDLQRSELLWRSKPLVGNAVNFSVLGDVIISAYGYMREGAKVYAIDKQDGNVVGELELEPADALAKRHPHYAILKGNQLFIKAADGTEYVVDVRR